MNNLPRPMKSCFLLTLACAVPALGQMMYLSLIHISEPTRH